MVWVVSVDLLLKSFVDNPIDILGPHLHHRYPIHLRDYLVHLQKQSHCNSAWARRAFADDILKLETEYCAMKIQLTHCGLMPIILA